MNDGDAILTTFERVAVAVRTAVAAIPSDQRRGRTSVPGQYALDLVADAIAVPMLHADGFRVLSEESGISGDDDAAITVVLDPVDGSTNCARGLSYWAISLCAIDAHGALCAMVVNQATGVVHRAVRGDGAFRDGERLAASPTQQLSEAVIALAGWPHRRIAAKQFRVLGCAALALCDLAAGGLDGYVDTGRWHAPWDYLGGVLICRESGAIVDDLEGEPLVIVDADARRQLVGGATSELHAALRTEVLDGMAAS